MLLFFHFSIYKQKYPPFTNHPLYKNAQHFPAWSSTTELFIPKTESSLLYSRRYIMDPVRQCLAIGTTNPNMSGLKPKCTQAMFRAIDHRSKFGCRLGLRFDVGVAVCYI